MITALRAEFRKILTVRSTYVIAFIVFALCIALVSFWVEGFKDAEKAAVNANALKQTIVTAIGVGSIILAFIALLSVGHEYRYNTVLYTLTNAASRTKTFFAKWIATVTVGLVIGAIMAVLSYGAFYIGQNVAGINTINQSLPLAGLAWRLAATVIGAMSLAFVIAMLLRSQIGAITTVLLLPTTIESILGLLLKDNVKYLPYTALTNITTGPSQISNPQAALIVAAYAVGIGLVAYVLFLRRDAN